MLLNLSNEHLNCVSFSDQKPLYCYECQSSSASPNYCSDPFNATVLATNVSICEGHCVKWVRQPQPGERYGSLSLQKRMDRCWTSTRFSCVLTTLDWECFKYREPIKNKTFLFSAKLKSLVSYEYSKISMIDNNVFDHENHGGIIVAMLYALFT